MKIDDSNNLRDVTSVNTTHKVKSEQPVADTDKKAQSATSASQAAAQNAERIRSLFARVGISKNMFAHDEVSRRRLIDRRRDILSLQRIKNLQAVMEVALSTSLTEASTESVDPDWFFAFTQLAENIYSPAMQTLWGKIFALEISHPGAFSMRSLETLKALTQRDAKIFALAVSLSCRRVGDPVPRILVGYHQKPGFWSLFGNRQPDPLNMASFGLSYPDILALTDMKLVFASEIESGELEQNKPVMWRCGNQALSLTPARSGLALVYYKFTSVGAELAKLIVRQESEGYLQALTQKLTGPFHLDTGNN